MRRILVLVAVALAAATGDAAAYGLRGFVIANGGEKLTGGSYVLHGTVGQAAVGISADANRELCHGFWCFGGPRVLSVDDGPPRPVLPTDLDFGLPFPNPARAAASFVIALPSQAQVDLAILDVQGRLVRRLASGHQEAGWQTLRWDGRDASGSIAGAGVYFARLLVDGRVVGTRRVVLRP